MGYTIRIDQFLVTCETAEEVASLIRALGNGTADPATHSQKLSRNIPDLIPQTVHVPEPEPLAAQPAPRPVASRQRNGPSKHAPAERRGGRGHPVLTEADIRKALGSCDTVTAAIKLLDVSPPSFYKAARSFGIDDAVALLENPPPRVPAKPSAPKPTMNQVRRGGQAVRGRDIDFGHPATTRPHDRGPAAPTTWQEQLPADAAMLERMTDYLRRVGTGGPGEFAAEFYAHAELSRLKPATRAQVIEEVSRRFSNIVHDYPERFTRTTTGITLKTTRPKA